MSTFLAVVKALPELLRLFNAIMDFVRVEEAKGIGRTEAINAGARLALQQIAEATEAGRAAAAAHASAPNNDTAFDTDFQRKD